MKRPLSRLSLSRAFTLSIVSLLGTLCVVLALAAEHTYDKASEQALTHEWLSSGVLASDTLSNAVDMKDYDFMSDYVRRIAAEPDVAGFSVYRLLPSETFDVDLSHRKMARTLDAREGVTFVEENDAYARRSLSVRAPIFEMPDDGSGAVVAFPIYEGDELWGAGRIDVRSDSISAVTWLLYQRLSVVALAFLGVGVLGGVVLARHVTRPLAKLTEVASRVKSGDLTVRCDLKRDDELGDLGHVFDTMIDGLRDAQSEVHGARAYLESIVESMIDALVVVEPSDDGLGWNGPLRIRSANRATMALLGRSEQELQGEPLALILPDEARRRALIDPLLGGGSVRGFDAEYMTRQGDMRPVRLSASAMRAGADNPHESGSSWPCGCVAACETSIHAIVIVATDVSEIRRSEKERARLGLAVEHAADAIIITDPDSNIEYVNPAFESMSGFSRTDALGQSLEIVASPAQSQDVTIELTAAMARGDNWHGRLENRRKDGSTYHVDAAVSPVRDTTGHIVNFVTVHHDVTHEVALEDQLRQAQKMEAVGKLAGGVAHDFNNLLSVVNGYAKLMLDELPPSTPHVDYVSEIHRAGVRATGLTRQLLAFSRRQVLKPRMLDLNEVMQDMQKMLRRLIGEDVELRIALADKLHLVLADPGQVEQVIMNLVVNARDAMPTGGKLTIESGCRDVSEEFADTHSELTAGPNVVLSITDSGSGMDAATLSQIFEPFFTTKEVGKGTGLGLSTVYGIVKQSGGHVSVYSEVGHGTTFRVYFPVAETTDDEDATTDEEEPPAMGSETVLVAEDEDGVRKLTVLLLRRSGYHVLEAEDGEVALELAAEYKGTIDLLVTDVVMPHMSGRTLYDALHRQRPETAVLYMSGYTDSAIVHHGVLDSGTPFLEKPYVPDQLLATVRALLDGDLVAAGVS